MVTVTNRTRVRDYRRVISRHLAAGAGTHGDVVEAWLTIGRRNPSEAELTHALDDAQRRRRAREPKPLGRIA